MEQLSESLFRHTDTCNVYILRNDRRAALVDFGDGSVLDALPDLGVETVTDVLVTHHHRDQVQGLGRLRGTGTRIHAPEAERHLIDQVDRHWAGRTIYNNYENATDRYSLLESEPVHESLCDYATVSAAGFELEVVPTPGHTLGSVSLRGRVDGQPVLFSGDFAFHGGRVWDLATTQWGYNDAAGIRSMLLTLQELRQAGDTRLLPSHGPTITDPSETLRLLEERLWRLLAVRGQDAPLRDAIAEPFVELTPHLLWSRATQSHNYFLLSDSGRVLMIDAGYPEATLAPMSRRHTRRAVDFATPVLRQRYGVRGIDVILPTHYHDDHVAGIPPLRRRYGARVWAAANFADLLARPAHYDVPCLWYEPIPVDRVLPLEEPFQWEEYTFRLHSLPGHTLYAVAIEFAVDGQRVLATGDQQGSAPALDNYIYRNRFRHPDYVASGALYDRVEPDLIVSGHWPPVRPDAALREAWRTRGAALLRLHEELLPLDEVDYGAEHAAAFIRPYQSWVEPGQRLSLTAEIRNPLPRPATLRVQVVCPEGWLASPAALSLDLEAGEWAAVPFEIRTGAAPVQRARVAVDLTAGGLRIGQAAEALVSVGFAPGPL